MSMHPDRQEGPPSPLRQIDQAADEFEREWRQGHHPLIPAYLEKAPAELRLQLLVELVYVDLEQRLRKKLPVTIESYFLEFPELKSLAPADRIALEAHARKSCEELGPTVERAPPAVRRTPTFPPMIGRYQIAGQIGTGGQADVFLSFHPELLVPVVVKWHRGLEPSDAASREHLVREGRILANLESNPNLVRVYDLGFHDNRPFLVLEHVQGSTLAQYAHDECPSPKQAAELIAALAEGVHLAHKQGIVHQDVSPGNVLIDGRGQPRLIDFGLAWFRSAGTDPSSEARPDGGTPQFLSPEQADLTIGPIDRRTDVFGLGAVLYFLLTGKPLYEGTTLAELMGQAAAAAYDAKPLEQPGVPKRLAAVCRKALARKPEDRFSTAMELATALRAAVRRPRWRGVASVAVLFLAAVWGGWLLHQLAWPGPSAAVKADQPALNVRVWRPETKYVPLRAALPVRTGDELQVRCLVPAGLHIGLFSIDGTGQLTLLKQYPPQATATELVYPESNRTRCLGKEVGTEILFVCGRSREPLSEADLETVWDRAAPWPALDPPERLLRLQPSRVREEGVGTENARGWGEERNRPESDTVGRRLEELRERLRSLCPFFEGLAFVHQ